MVRVTPNLMIANMCAQDSYPSAQRPQAVSYAAVEQCMQTVLYDCMEFHAVLHMPRIGCGLGGGQWPQILESIWDAKVQVSARPMPETIVYDLPPRR